MTTTTRRRRAPRGISLTFPAGFVELTTGREPRHAYWEQELATYYPELDRATRSRLLSLIGSTDMPARLGGLADHVRVAVGLALDGRDVEGAVLLTVTAVRAPDGWSPSDLRTGLEAAARSRPTLRPHRLPCPAATAVAVERPRHDLQRTDVFLADPRLNAVVVISAFALTGTRIDLRPTLIELVNTYQAV